MAERPTRSPAEPEIIPPDRGGEKSARGRARVHVFIARSGGRLGAPWLVAILLALLTLSVIAAALLVLLVGLVAIWIPALIVLAALAALFRLFRGRRIGPPTDRLPTR